MNGQVEEYRLNANPGTNGKLNRFKTSKEAVYDPLKFLDFIEKCFVNCLGGEYGLGLQER